MSQPVDGARSNPDALCVPSRSRHLPIAVAAVQVATLAWVVFIWAFEDVPEAGTKAAVLGAVMPPVIFGSVALFGWWALQVASPESRTVRVACWTIECLTAFLAAFFLFELIFGLVFGGILVSEF